MTHQTVRRPRPGLPDDPHGHTPEPSPSCPVEVALTALKGRWTTLVIRELLRGEHTFTELREALPALSDKVLSDRLAHLTETGVVTRRREPAWPSRTHYELTPSGKRLGPVLQSLWNWGTAHPHQEPSTAAAH
ncbi:winged helix-turn-helix transcriptional regulator [Actinomadura terrae]|uniref:winged helix-turn-helix transcriptional regulator n=1 Tax=Actinomadura terrae TaxID=604353 RepID=UPI001FA7C503|nr:helix-turn-helix domain-containing protein [Actinomadura terrae]